MPVLGRCQWGWYTGQEGALIRSSVNIPIVAIVIYQWFHNRLTKFLNIYQLVPISWANTAASFKVYYTLKESKARQRVLFFHPKYLKNLALFWRTKGVTEYRLSSGLMITSVAVELCENVKLYGFWPFSKTGENTPVSHHYYDNKLPKRGFHEMPKEYRQILQLHVKGILRLQFSKCEIA
ncbi:hypothetical protein J1605_009870 [Eschrichtius robustus]|uniref:Alpha-2,8-sialyltransferase 8F n=1 Tax=Eschrichtius robustus TaxID=9764 RepID=A0AB34GU34_ESCRO|nr:hypothetical protein J1605_009870 [Eschrichtius robustus]